jgi:hypothetical protein
VDQKKQRHRGWASFWPQLRLGTYLEGALQMGKLTYHYHLVNHIFDTPGTWDGWPVNIPTRNILSSPQDAAAARLVVNHSMVSFRPSRKEVFARQPNSRAALEVSSERRG